MCIRTGHRITHKKNKELPMPHSVIKRAEGIAEKEKQDKTLVFSDRDDNEFVTGNFDPDGMPMAQRLAETMANI
jgi:hypothetical protein